MKSFLFRSLIFALLPLTQTFAQVGNDNLTGVSGAFNGSVGTGCSYDPYTANATRVITDITIDGAVGTIPLALSRIYNSRGGLGGPFGPAGSWVHNYSWVLEDSAETGPWSSKPGNYSPTSYSVDFPDGRSETFTHSASDTDYRAAVGVSDRFIPLNTSTVLAYLVLPDGSKVEFSGNEKFSYDGELHQWWAWYTYTATALIDPYGLRTTFTYNVDGTLQKVTEPAGRTIQFYYTTVGGLTVIDHVTGSDGRTVQYYYVQSAYSPGTTSYVSLDHIVYYGDSQWTATYRYQAPNVGSANGTPLLWKCDDPLYSGPMKRIAYTYRTTNNADNTSPVYGEIQSENYYDGTNIGAAVTTLSVNNSTRTETRADTKTRTLTYTSAKLTSGTDFKGISASKTYDSNGYINSVTDRNGHTTNFTLNALTGVVLTTTFPSTPGDTPPNTPRGVVTTTYGWASCPDPNNQDANNPYYPYSVTDEGGHTSVFLRDTNKRVTTINYPDGGTESFTYNSFGEILTHVNTSGGTEASTYDASGNKLTYRDAYHDPVGQTGNPSAWYSFDSANRLSGVTDALGSAAGDVNHTTSYGYNARSQLTSTTFPTDPIDSQRHTITNVYNSDGTLQSTTDQLGHLTSYTYDDYRRPLTVTTPGHNTPVTAYSYYDASGTGNDYTHTDANVTHATLPSGKKTTTTYDENLRKTSLTVADGTSDAAKTSFGYDNVGNVTSVISPKEQSGQPYAGQSTVTTYDERNRLMSVTDALGNVTSCTYDAAAHKASATRPNGQVTTFDSYDSMNRLLQQTVKQTPDPDAVTKYTYYTSGLLHTMQDPRLVALNNGYNYSYSYDQMGRKTGLTYPPDSYSVARTEAWHYDTAGRVDTFTNRAGTIQTTVYDALNRANTVSWNDGALTPTVTLGYDVASRTTSTVNANATISYVYFNDNLLNTETTTYADTTARTVTYTYDADGNRATIQYPAAAYSFTYNYTNRNQLNTLVNNSGGGTVITYLYDLDGNLTTRTPNNSTHSAYTYDGLDRVTDISHVLNGTTRTLDYAYDSVSNRKWTKRDGGNGDVFGYDLNDQSIAVLLNVANPDTTPVGNQTIVYDANGNRTSFSTDTYSINNLNQYTSRNSSNATYDYNGNMTVGLDGSTYTYDSQNRLLTATKAGTTDTLKYDGLNRQVSRKVGSGSVVYKIYDGWNLIGDYASGATTATTAYLFGAGGLVKNLTANRYYYQDASGCTSHLAGSSGGLLEWYRYDLQGSPIFYNASNTQISASAYGIRHLFTGQQWYSELGLYDLRNRFYSPDIGRFLQGDPLGFGGDATNLYRYCSNNALKFADPTGLGGYYPGMNEGPMVGGRPLTPWEQGLYRSILMGTIGGGVLGGVSGTVEGFILGTGGYYVLNPSPDESGVNIDEGPLPFGRSPDSSAPVAPNAMPTNTNLPPQEDTQPNPVDTYSTGGNDSGSSGSTVTLPGVVVTAAGPGTFQMGTFIAGGTPGYAYGSDYGSMGYSLIGVPGTFVTTDSGQTYSTASAGVDPTGGGTGGYMAVGVGGMTEQYYISESGALGQVMDKLEMKAARRGVEVVIPTVTKFKGVSTATLNWLTSRGNTGTAKHR